MAVYFVETSALAKRSIAETGSLWLRALLDPSTGSSIDVVRVTAVEMIAAITRRERGRTLTPTDAAAARQAFRQALASTYQIIEVTPQRLPIERCCEQSSMGYALTMQCSSLPVSKCMDAMWLPGCLL